MTPFWKKSKTWLNHGQALKCQIMCAWPSKKPSLPSYHTEIPPDMGHRTGILLEVLSTIEFSLFSLYLSQNKKCQHLVNKTSLSHNSVAMFIPININT